MRRSFINFVVIFLTITVLIPSLSSGADDSPVTVGRIYHIEGSLLRYVQVEDDWVAAVRDAPFGTGDALYAGAKSHAELIIPNGTLIRIDENTQIQLVGMESDISEVDVAAGLARFYNRNSDLVVKVTSPFGYVLVYPGGAFDFYVGENSAEIVPVRGRITFIHSETNARYELSYGDPSILADQGQVSSVGDGVDPNWDGWNRERDSFWTSKESATGRSAQYLPPALRHDAYVFEDNGRWEQVSYEGGNHWFWRPTRIPTDWAPFTNGRWTEWYGDQTWIPYEPFGYTTHHYGNWIFVRGRWYWAPPVVRATVGLPLLNIGFFWYPGRVSWIHSGSYVGWIPLAPRERYYSYYRWGGPYVIYVNRTNRDHINIYPRNYAFARHAIIVPQRNLYGVNSYGAVRVMNINHTTIINNYRGAPIVDNRVIHDYSSIKLRHNFANIDVREKPHRTVTERIQSNQRIIQQGKLERAAVIEREVKGIREGKINKEAKIQQPRVTNFIVPANEVNRPKSEIKLQQKEIKRTSRDPKNESSEPAKVPAKPTRPSPKQDIIVPAKPDKPVAKPESATPDKPDQPISKPDRPKTVKPRQFEKSEEIGPVKPGGKPESVAPSKPVSKPEVVTPVRQMPKSEKAVVDRPGRKIESDESEKPAPKPTRVPPPKVQVKEVPDKAPPAKDTDQDQPSRKAARNVPAKVVPQDNQRGEPYEQGKPR